MGASPDSGTNDLQAGSVDAAFSALVASKAWEYGHGGYSGSLAEKDSYVEVARVDAADELAAIRLVSDSDEEPTPEENIEWARIAGATAKCIYRAANGECHHLGSHSMTTAGATLAQARDIYDEKWGPAALIVVTKDGKPDHIWAGGYCSS